MLFGHVKRKGEEVERAKKAKNVTMGRIGVVLSDLMSKQGTWL
jgi:hypothetical protein